MRAPKSWIAEHVGLPANISDQQIAEALVRVGFEIEEIIVQGADLKGPLVVGKVLAVEELQDQKKPIRYVELDCGESQSRFVICGAENFKAGDLIVASLPGAVLSGGFAISARETYGKTSNGMICSARELGLGEDHSGIIVLPANSAIPGDDAIELLQMKDTIFDVAVNPDRGYALSIRGIAREIASALGLTFQDPAKFEIDFKESGTAVTAKISDGAQVMYLRTLQDFNPAAPSPLWMRRRIEKCGMRSISLAVDVTNYVMIELGQPLHAFDADQISGELEIRRARSSEKLKTLDGVERTLDPDDLVVADSKKVLALAGTMGGLDSEITETTTRIAVEAVRFDATCIAKNSRRHKLSSEASRRFERGVDPTLAEISSARAAQLLILLGGAKYVGTSIAGATKFLAPIILDLAYISKRIGMEIPAATVKEKLELVGCQVEGSSEFKVTPPTWRTELFTQADLSEEVARNIGYDQIPSILPARKVTGLLTPAQKRQRVLAQTLVARGYTEILNFPFVNQQVIDKLGFVGARAQSYKIANPMSEDLPYLRPHLLPGLLEAARRNCSRGFKSFSLFEMGVIFRKSIDLKDGISPAIGKRPSDNEIADIFASVPTQLSFVCGVLIGQVADDTWHGKQRNYEWSDAVAAVEVLLTLLGLQFTITRSDLAPWHPGRCAEFIIDGKPVAHAGELHPRVVSEFALPERSAAWAINLDALPPSPLVSPKPVGVMPAAVQDIALIVDSKITAAELTQALKDGAGELLESITLFDRYDKISDGKISLAFTLTFRAPGRTLKTEEVSAAREAAAAQALKRCGAIVRA
jgi:phenylalanyl-tRNA synthetase beta chain